jgi:NAD(P)-dependent dehydrogenase (short-subunit alcohol dehydrogenase family)
VIFDAMKLDGNVAIITGSGRGLGRAMALALAEAGADIVVTARTKPEIEETAQRVRRVGRKALTAVCDVREKSSVDQMVNTALAEFGRIDILVNNAGVAIVKPLLDFSPEEWHTTIDSNLTGIFFCCQAVGPIMMQQGGGKIINITSINGARGKAQMVPYASSKGGVIQLTRALAVEWAPYHINVNAIGPGAFYTRPMKVVLDDAALGKIRRKKIPLKRDGKPDEIGPLVVYLASKASDFMTGEVIYIDGGELAKL